MIKYNIKLCIIWFQYKVKINHSVLIQKYHRVDTLFFVCLLSLEPINQMFKHWLNVYSCEQNHSVESNYLKVN